MKSISESNTKSAKNSSRLRNSPTVFRRVLLSCGITLLAFLFSMIMMSPLSASTSALFSVPERNDFTITDFYSLVADSRAVSHLDDNIVIVNIDESDRNEIAEILDIVSLAGAKAVCLDVMFDSPREGDEPLLSAISNCRPPLIQPLVMRKTAFSADTFSIASTSFFYHSDIDSATVYASASMPSKYHKSVIREVQLKFPVRGGEDVPSMPLAVARVADPQAAVQAESRGGNLETINYHSRRFRVIMPDELIDNADEIKDRIVMIGVINDPVDQHPTPVNTNMSGVMIHAHSLATILDGNYMNNIPEFVNILIAFVLCLIVVMVYVFMTSGMRGMLLRALQILFVWLTVQVGYWLFVSHNVIVDFSYSLLMLAFGLFACDIWNGLAFMFGRLRTRLTPLFARLSKVTNIKFSSLGRNL